RGFDDTFYVPHSRYTYVDRKDIESIDGLKILASSPEAGVHIVSTAGGRQFFIMGHAEYDALTLDAEYRRDINSGVKIDVPKNYYPDNDPSKEPIVSWRSHGNLLYTNWLNYFVYQSTPYDLKTLKKID
ncbi:MAG: homoserine O-succinyltransferase, partial [Clostridia bacterium]|nr:homoserine O-succinyltransferase [Clostridia bacterium]